MKNTKSTTRVRNQSVISRLFSMGTITAEQFLAATRLQSLHSYTEHGHNLKSKFMITLSSKANRQSGYEGLLYAKDNIKQALEKLNNEEKAVVEWVVMKDEYLKYYCEIKARENKITNMSKDAYKKYVYRVLCHALDKIAKNHDHN